MTRTVQTAVVGVTGYAGAELARLLLRHPRLKGQAPVFAGRVDEKDLARGGVPLSEIHPQLADNNGSATLKLEPFSWGLLAERGVDVLFLATPHEQSREWAPEALRRGLRVIDLSGAWRLTEVANRAVYAFADDAPGQPATTRELAQATQAQAVYGMPELHRAEIAGARLIANPGCYATSIILALRPLVAAGLVDLAHGIVADAKSGVSGAGKSPTARTHYMYAADNLSAYGAFTHRHTGELLEQVGIGAGDITFTPHLPVDDLRSLRRAADQGRGSRSVPAVFCRQSHGQVARQGAAADSIRGPHQLRGHRFPTCRRRSPRGDRQLP